MAESTVKLTTKDLKSLLQPITNVLPRGQKLIFKEVLELAGNASKHLKVKRITPRNLQLVIRGDEELDTLIKGIIAGGGVIPHIHKSLILTVGTSLKKNVNNHHVGYSSDGSQNSNKRRREASPANIKATPAVSKPLRIRFVFKKPSKEAEVFLPREDRLCSTSGTDQPSIVSSSSVSAHDENLVSTSLENDKTAVPSESKKKKKHRISKETRYSSLFDEPVLPCILMEVDDDNNSDDWLLGARRHNNARMNEQDMVSNMHKSGDSCFPSPQFLPDVEIFSLPYTVLF
ncbi:Histone-fold protein [Raphanus sativus]|nr:Histone-fold protein [Raphanus sativus]